ncbi:MAG TPA: 2-C-methyl-D-erythritol 2,4-cyclodiphosphate synthase [Candidatus Limnocylindrales bacterium]|nr:2-C-methyl-D-erythritol 2,4-cyclodiphosphate synthase [Candidatus Limnocylindrales bacterium]
MLRIGQGYDIHRLVAGRPLWLGLIEIPFDRGSLGHSDGDVAAHALCDALLSAAGLGDMGVFFPSNDMRWKDARSSVFLAEVRDRLAAKHATIVSADVTIVIEKPRLAPHIEAMRSAMANELRVGTDVLSIKAKTSDGIGPVGESAAVASLATVLVELA